MQSRQDEERKTYALNLRIRQSSVSATEDQGSVRLPEAVKDDEENGLEMKTIATGDD